MMDPSFGNSAPEIEILREKVVYENNYGQLYDDDVRFSSSNAHGTYVRWVWKVPFSVAVLPLVGESKALLIKSYRHAARKVILEAVKGFGANAADPKTIARAEARQEVGFECSSLEYVGALVADPAFNYHPTHCFLGWGLLTEKGSPEESEVIEGVEEVDIYSTTSLMKSGKLQDPITLILLWQAQQRVGEEYGTPVSRALRDRS
ncbi:NUDIX hydrolase [Streptomyces sp. NPDC060035]|uniref:NUDIX hydrolase n=1 Tax=Streptomyces sp. NPDC060035 TaxID=3347044 RepID=UPI0036CD81CE